jgi:hypothetical protein
LKSTPVSNDPIAVVVDETVVTVAIVEGIVGTGAVVLVEVAEGQGVVVVVVKMVVLSSTSMIKPPSLP